MIMGGRSANHQGFCYSGAPILPAMASCPSWMDRNFGLEFMHQLSVPSVEKDAEFPNAGTVCKYSEWDNLMRYDEINEQMALPSLACIFGAEDSGKSTFVRIPFPEQIERSKGPSGWIREETEALLLVMSERACVAIGVSIGDEYKSALIDGLSFWDFVSEKLLDTYGFDRASDSCKQQWRTQLQNYRDIVEHESKTPATSYWDMNEDERSEKKLPRTFNLKWCEMIKKLDLAFDDDDAESELDEKLSGESAGTGIRSVADYGRANLADFDIEIGIRGTSWMAPEDLTASDRFVYPSKPDVHPLKRGILHPFIPIIWTGVKPYQEIPRKQYDSVWSTGIAGIHLPSRPWIREETEALLLLMSEALDKGPGIWDYVSENLFDRYNFDRASDSCKQHWRIHLQKNYREIVEHEFKTPATSYWDMNEDERSEKKLPRTFNLEWCEMIEKMDLAFDDMDAESEPDEGLSDESSSATNGEDSCVSDCDEVVESNACRKRSFTDEDPELLLRNIAPLVKQRVEDALKPRLKIKKL